MAEVGGPDRGRKVIFLYPHSVVADQLVQAIAHAEYEVYLVRNHLGLKRVLALPEFEDSLLVVNIDEELSDPDWKAWVRSLRESPATSHVHVGILTYNEDAALAAAYLMDIGVQGGFIRLKLGLAESTRIILATLVATEAKGKRKFVRADCTGLVNVAFNAKIRGELVSGRLHDISSVGMACTFDTDPNLGRNAALPDIQLKLKGSIVMLSGTVAGTRQANSDHIYVVMFTQPHPAQVKERLFRFIRECLQSRMEKLLESSGRS